MIKNNRLSRSYFSRDTVTVAREILGCRLVHIQNSKRISGIIIEAEAYCGEDDLGCHAKAGLTERTKPMFGPPGHAYVYFTYGMHWLFNIITQPEGQPEAVLIRAIVSDEGIDLIKARRGKQPRKNWTNGPAKLTQALGISKEYNEYDLTKPDATLFIEEAFNLPDQFVTTSPRIGLFTVPEPWKSIPWRFLAALPEAWIEHKYSKDKK